MWNKYVTFVFNGKYNIYKYKNKKIIGESLENQGDSRSK
jgi:hypothetical protein